MYYKNPRCLKSVCFKKPPATVRVSSFFTTVPREKVLARCKTPEKIVIQAKTCDRFLPKPQAKNLQRAEHKLIMSQLPFSSSKPFVPKTDYFHLSHENSFQKQAVVTHLRPKTTENSDRTVLFLKRLEQEG